MAETALAAGDFVIGSFRNQLQVDAFNAAHIGSGHALKLDISQSDEIELAVETVTKTYGRVDVLVNNAGTGIAGAIEEVSVEETRHLFEANFFGTLFLTRRFLPLFRQQQQGHIIQISSHGGFKASAGFGIYNASKFALEGFSEALAQELEPLGIHVTIVEPGPFRTGFAGENFRLAARSIKSYALTAGVFRSKIKEIDGKQEGDPMKAAKAIFAITKLNSPPLRLPLGKTALASLQAKITSVQANMETYRAVAEGTVF
jgi:NAD(P)-dependent dehydrogenase (short-subunit alcohol dehydrogenase family)